MEFADRQSDFGPNIPSHGVWVNNGICFSTAKVISQHCTRCLAFLIRSRFHTMIILPEIFCRNIFELLTKNASYDSFRLLHIEVNLLGPGDLHFCMCFFGVIFLN